MFGVSLIELVVILAVALLIFGPDRLPEVARTLGKLAGQFRRSSDAVRRDFYNAIYTPTQELGRDIEKASRELRTFPVSLLNDSKDPNCPDSQPKHDCPDCSEADAAPKKPSVETKE